MKKILIALAVVATLTACSSRKDAESALTSAGFTKIETQGYSFFGCGDDDTFKTKFTAQNPQGKQVSGVVCSGWFKGGTIRF